LNKLLFPPQTEWVPPASFPDLSSAKEIAIDLETCDPNMENMGPGWARKDGYIIGYAVAVEGWKGYFPVAHQGGGNLDKTIVERFIKKILSYSSTKIFHNAAYDVGWLMAHGFDVKGKIIDTMIAAPLLDENRFSYSLNALGFDYLSETKSEKGLKEAAASFGVHPKKELWKLPAMFVGEYAEQDAELTFKLWQHFKLLLRKEELESIFELETKLLPILIDMTRRGIRFDRDKALSLVNQMKKEEKDLSTKIEDMSGMPVDIWAAQSIAKAFDNLKIEYPRTETGLPSFKKSFLESHEHKVSKLIVEAREAQKTYSTFLQPYLDFSKRDGRIHTHINQLRSETGGTVSGRLSANSPNLQQVPVRHKTIGPLVRSLFLPEEKEQWAACDFSSQEPRLLVHYAHLLGLDGADTMKRAYDENPDTDFHQMVADMASIERKPAKTIGLGLCYGMGKNKLANELNMEVEDASELINIFHEKVPFLKGTIEAVMRRIEHPKAKGSIRTLLGRKCRFNLWEPTQWGVHKALPYEQALADYGPRIKRAYTYKGLNRLIQGSAADQTKASMIALHEAGFTLLLQIHDEIALSVKNKEEAREAANIMCNAVKLEIPSKVDIDTGQTWGDSL
jgi:DNA polymerase I-like protein with 3'-5' exonuclease and polymerase domains